MKKPEPKARKEVLDYHECADYIAHKLGVDDLRDFSGKYMTPGISEDLPYQDFWHFLYDSQDIGNPSYIFIPRTNNDFEDWQIKICKAFHEEFGEDAEYWVEW